MLSIIIFSFPAGNFNNVNDDNNVNSSERVSGFGALLVRNSVVVWFSELEVCTRPPGAHVLAPSLANVYLKGTD